MDPRYAVILGCIAAYLGFCVVVGIWTLRRTGSTQDFFMAGRGLGVMVTAMAVFSSTVSGFAFVGGPAHVYKAGMSSLWMVVSCAMGACITFFVLGKRLRLMAELEGAVSLPSLVAARYGRESLRLLSAVAILLGVFGYLAVQVRAMGTLIQSLLQGSGLFPGIGLAPCVVTCGAVLVFYCVTGGILASVYTDLVQGIVMVIASVLVFLTARSTFEGGFTEMSRVLLADDPEAAGPWGTLGVVGCVSWFFVFAVGNCGQPHVISKLMMSRRPADLRSILPITLLAGAISGLLWLGVGIAMRSLVVSGADAPLERADQAAAVFLQSHATPWLAGVVFAGLLAAIMSTADGFLNIGAAAVVHDIPVALTGRTPRRELLVARIATAGIAVVAGAIALWSEQMIAILGAFGWGTFAAALVPVVALGFNWKRATPLAAGLAMVASLLVNFLPALRGWSLPHALDRGAVALVVSLVVFVAASLLTPPVAIDRDVAEIMDL